MLSMILPAGYHHAWAGSEVAIVLFALFGSFALIALVIGYCIYIYDHETPFAHRRESKLKKQQQELNYKLQMAKVEKEHLAKMKELEVHQNEINLLGLSSDLNRQ